MTVKDGTRGTADLKALVASDPDFVRVLMRTALQEVLEAEMSEALGAGKGERTEERLGYRSGYYGRTLVTRVGKLELRVPQDRDGRFSEGDHRGAVATGSRPRASAQSTSGWMPAWPSSPAGDWRSPTRT
jgi:hypothetical protein